MIISKIDGTKCKNLLGLRGHLKKYKMSTLEYFLKYESFEIPKCNCGKERKYKQTIYFYETCGDKECIAKLTHSPIVYTEEYREECRKRRIEYLKKKTGKTAWERRAAGEMSYLEKWFYDEVILKYNLHKKYDIVSEYSEYPYFLDFAFVNIKLAFELDGKSHFKNGKERIEHDIKRDKILNSKGWTIYRIRYDEINKETVNNILRYLQSNNQDEKKLPERVVTYTEIKPKYEAIKRINNNLKRDEIEKQFIPLILNSKIIFHKFGWVQEVSKLINKKPQKIKKWMIKYMSEFYESNCFKRK